MTDKKINSFTQQPSPTQILSYAVVVGDIIIFYVCMTPNFQSMTNSIVFSCLFGVASIIVIVSAVITSIIDPSDSVIREHREARNNKATFVNKDYLYCGNCDSYCHESAKHCKACNRCVRHFDHHCIWINNCIGEDNYRPFFVMIVSVFAQLGLYVAAGIVLSLERNFYNYLPQMIAIWVYMLIVAVLMFLDLNLVLLHVYLNAKKMTTYQLIMAMREEQRLDKIAALNKKKSEEETRRKVQAESQMVRISIQPKESSNVMKINPRIQDKATDEHRNDRQGIEPKDSATSKNQQNSDKHEISEQQLHIKPRKRDSKNNMFDIAQEEVMSSGDVSIMGDNHHPGGSNEEKNARISRFITKNKSLHFIISDTGVQNPTNPKILRVSDLH